jgi:site-specific DNA recombinase
VPEVGGRVDPGSEAHQYAGATGGVRFLGGRPPYGYQLAVAGPHPSPSKAAHGQRLRRLEVDESAAKVVQRNFREYIESAGLGAIAEGLNRDRIPSPSGHDPQRNQHRASANGAWGKSAVRAILGNPQYSGCSA